MVLTPSRPKLGVKRGVKRSLGFGTFAPDLAPSFKPRAAFPRARKTIEGDDSTVPVGFTLERQSGKDGRPGPFGNAAKFPAIQSQNRTIGVLDISQNTAASHINDAAIMNSPFRETMIPGLRETSTSATSILDFNDSGIHPRS
jgi:hypothetical protein